MLNFTTPGTTFDFSGGFNWFLETDFLTGSSAVTCTEISGCGAGENFCTVECPIISSNFYRLRIKRGNTPSTGAGVSPNALQLYYLTVS
jgi:hypothetical protein